MISLLNKNTIFALVGVSLVVALYFYINNLKNDIKEYKLKLSECKLQSINYKRESELLKVSLNKQNEKINSLEVDHNKSIVELNKWKNKPAKVRYKTIYKTIYKNKVVKSNDCKDIKSILNNVRELDFNVL